jgi:hypothetical protein
MLHVICTHLLRLILLLMLILLLLALILTVFITFAITLFITPQASILALRSCLSLIAKRASRMRSEWYYKIYREVKKGLQSSDNAHAIHGSLLTVGEMLKNTGECVCVCVCVCVMGC